MKKILAHYKTITNDAFGAFQGFQRGLAVALLWILSFYIVFTQYTTRSAIFTGVGATVIALLLTILLTVAGYQVLKLAFYLLKHSTLAVSQVRGRFPLPWFFWVLGGVLALQLLFFVYYYPGGVSFDNLDQWAQVVSFSFTNWHPVFHTFLMWLFTRPHESYPFLILIQVVIFSLGVAYLIAVLASWGLKKRWLVAILVLVATNCNTTAILQFALKDTAFLLAALFLAAQCINIVLSQGDWLGRRLNIFAFVVCVTVNSLLRHNSFLLTVPLMVLIWILYAPHRRRVLVAGGLSLLLVLLVRGPLYSALHVTFAAEQTYVEAVGLPMTIMADVKMQNPDALDAETTAFLRSILPDEEWERLYILHDYNSVKWYTDANAVVARVPPADFIRMTLNTIKSDPRNSYLAFVGLTDMVWRTDKVEVGAWVWTAEGREDEVKALTARDNLPPEGLAKAQQVCAAIVEPLNAFLYTPWLYYLATCLGLYLLVLLFLGMFSVLYRRKMGALVLVLPVMLYNVVTMLLLAGNDYRLFQFNLVIIVPYAFVLFARQQPLYSAWPRRRWFGRSQDTAPTAPEQS